MPDASGDTPDVVKRQTFERVELVGTLGVGEARYLWDRRYHQQRTARREERATYHRLAANGQDELRSRPLGKVQRREKVVDEVVEDVTILGLGRPTGSFAELARPSKGEGSARRAMAI